MLFNKFHSQQKSRYQNRITHANLRIEQLENRLVLSSLPIVNMVDGEEIDVDLSHFTEQVETVKVNQFSIGKADSWLSSIAGYIE